MHTVISIIKMHIDKQHFALSPAISQTMLLPKLTQFTK